MCRSSVQLLPGLLAGWVRILDLETCRGARRAYFPYVVAGYCAGLAATYAALLANFGSDQVLLHVIRALLQRIGRTEVLRTAFPKAK